MEMPQVVDRLARLSSIRRIRAADHARYVRHNGVPADLKARVRATADRLRKEADALEKLIDKA
jgi:hypothetical protein